MVACGSSSKTEDKTEDFQSELVDPNSWQALDQSRDPYKKNKDSKLCEKDGDFKTELLGGLKVFAIRTDYCNYLTVGQKSLGSIKKGDEINFRFYHFPLKKPEGESAFVSVKIESQVIWEKSFKIPVSAKFEKAKVKAEKEYPKGSKIYFHVNNHGQNEYVFVELSLIP